MCDEVPHCRDGSDEEQCGWLRKERESSLPVPPPAVITFDGHGDAVVVPLHTELSGNVSVCPDTHFQCADNG